MARSPKIAGVVGAVVMAVERGIPSSDIGSVHQPVIAVYLITYRRPELLRRALGSVLGQTYRNLIVRIVNDDPSDGRVSLIATEFGDARVQMFTPPERRGATRNFNLMFLERDAEFSTMLEDDNWWEPRFIQEMLATLVAHEGHDAVFCNERIWREADNGDWLDTGVTVWSGAGVWEHDYAVEEICGPAKICTSAMFVRVPSKWDLRTPDTIPMDVTEHFRQRRIPRSPLLYGTPLVNYSVTRETERARNLERWGQFQSILIGSVFIAAAQSSQRRNLATRLWRVCEGATVPRAVSLVATGIAFKEARPLIWSAPIAAILRSLLWMARKPSRVWNLWALRRRYVTELSYLVDAPLTEHLVEKL